ncbi:MAG: DUF4976 domain-containing protein, partial [Planctomycetaceae bacterium]|nr:DUF4976 domain-containing protein [Planctomycetaceae bacterium]
HGDGADMRSYQTERWKLIRYFRGNRPDEFYDRVLDPSESTNLIESSVPMIESAIRQLDDKLKVAMQQIDDPLVREKSDQ